MIRVVVVDDQAIVRDGVVTVLGAVAGLEVVGEAADGKSAVDIVLATRPDVVLMDLRMPVLDGAEATRLIIERLPSVAVLVLTTFADDDSISRALQAGARGYLTKDAGREQLAAAITSVAAGQTILASNISRQVLGQYTSYASQEPTSQLDPERLSERYPALTIREVEVLSILLAGRSNAEISAALFISLATVKSHVNSIYAKLHTSTRAQTIALLLAVD